MDKFQQLWFPEFEPQVIINSLELTDEKYGPISRDLVNTENASWGSVLYLAALVVAAIARI
jgi:hypothetical protein